MKWKIVPCGRFDIRGRELFLEQCAREGWRPAAMGAYICRLNRAEPRELRYRLEPFRQKGGVPEELLGCYRESGWAYAFSGDVFAVFCAEDPAAPEPYSDAESCAMALEFLDGALKRYARTRLVAAAVLLALLVMAVAASSPWRLILVLLGVPLTGWLWLLGLQPWQAVQDWRRLRRLRDSFAAGVRPGPGKSRVWANRCMVGLTALMAAVVLVSGAAGLQEPPVPEGHVSIVELEQRYPVTWDFSTAERSGVSLLCPRQWCFQEFGLGPEVDQALHLPGVGLFDHGARTQYHPSLEVADCRLLPILARPMARGLMDLMQPVNISFTYRELDVPGTDLALLADGGNSQSLALSRGGHLLVYHYNGAERLENHVELLLRPL